MEIPKNPEGAVEEIYKRISMFSPLRESHVAYLDVLGFKNVVKNNPSRELERIYNMLYSLSLVNVSSKPMKTRVVSGVPIGTADLSSVLVNMLFFSDSIILWSDETTILSFIKIIWAVKKFLVSGFLYGYPMKGAIVKGLLGYQSMVEDTELHVNGQLIYGPSLVNAVEIEKRQCWSGCIIEQECIDHYEELVKINHMEKIANIDILVKNNALKKYKVPLDDGTIDSYVINWTTDPSINETVITESFGKYNKPTELDHVQNIISNTLSFFKGPQDQ